MDPSSSFQELKVGGSVLFLSEEKLVKKSRWESSWVTRADFPGVPLSEEFKRNSFSLFLSADQLRSRFQGTNEFRENQNVSQAVNLSAFLMEEMRRRLCENIFFVTAQRNIFHFSGKEQQGSFERDDRPRSIGGKGEKAIDTLSLMAGPRGDATAIKKIKKWLEKFGLPDFVAGLAVQPGSGTLTDASFRDPDFGLSMSLPMAGFGSVQMVPVVAQIFCAPPGSTVMIEEPEISLHPAAQVLLPALFIDAVKSGRQVIMSTHSELLVTALRYYVKKKHIQSSDVALYDVKKGSEGAKANRIVMNEDGVLPDWVPSFAEVEKRMLDEWQDDKK